MISLSEVSVSLGGRPIVGGISLTAEAASWTCLIGPNGSGKTTLLRAVGGLVPYSGLVLVGGESPVRAGRRKLARTLAYVPQNRVIPDGLAVQDYVLLGRTPYVPYLGTETKRDLEIVGSALAKLRLEDLARRTLGSLSGGELQRAIIARALAQQPQVLLLDEPTSGLDVGHQQQVLELIDALRREHQLTVLSAIHDLTLAAQFADRLVLLDGGRICASGPPGLLLTEELLMRHYGARVRIVDDPAGAVAVIPLRNSGSVAEASAGGRREVGHPEA
jgi:iron complex transport system ATP-binding protein